MSTVSTPAVLLRAQFRCVWSYLERHDVAVIFCIALLLRVALLLWTGAFRETAATEAVNVAFSLVRHNLFADPNPLAETGPTATVPPVYPYFLSLLLRLTGDGVGFALVRQIIAAVAASAQYALLPVVGRRIGLGTPVGIIAGLAGALLPIRQWIETAGGHENVHAGLALLGLFLISVPLWEESQKRVARAALCGIAWGAGLLLSPTLLSALVAILIVPPILDRKRALNSLVTAAVAVVVLLPWTLRNFTTFHAVVPLRSSLGLELAISNSDVATGVESWNGKSWSHPFTQKVEAEKMRQLGEVAYYAMKKSEGMHWILAHPARFARLTALRILYFWFTPVYGFAKGLFMGLLTAGGFLGLWMLFRAHSPHAASLAGVWLLFPIPYYFLHVGPRYRYPIDWMFWLLASHAIYTLMSRSCGRRAIRLGGDSEGADGSRLPHKSEEKAAGLRLF